MREGLPAHPSSVGRARRLVREELRGTSLEPLTDTAELVVSEVVTNAIVHTGGDIELAAAVRPSGLRVEVMDCGSHLPVVSSYGATATTGRGLQLVAELVDRWGVVARPDGKVVWFHLGPELRDDGPVDPDLQAPAATPDPVPDGDEVEVVLLAMPALVHGAWQQHAKALLREYLLVGLAGDAAGEIEAHAAAVSAIAVLEEQVGTPQGTEDPDELLISLVEPRATWDRLRIVVPRSSVPDFATLFEQLEAALVHARAGRTLTPPTQPEFAAFRRWLCDQVRTQAEGGPPRPWSTPERPATFPVARGSDWDGSEVTRSPRAAMAANDVGLIVAASPSASTLLGYDDEEGLVGRRLVEIIPRRYHQAHLAGFTLHQITGRSPLIGRAVVVPALRRDGSEVEVRLRITTTRAPDGAAVFLAELERASD